MLVDTNIIVDRLRGSTKAQAYFASLESIPAMSVLTVTELVAGARSQKEEAGIQNVVRTLTVLPATEAIARRAGEWLRHFGDSHGLDFPDAIIAATAEQHGLPLATLNLKHFPMFPMLKRPY